MKEIKKFQLTLKPGATLSTAGIEATQADLEDQMRGEKEATGFVHISGPVNKILLECLKNSGFKKLPKK